MCFGWGFNMWWPIGLILIAIVVYFVIVAFSRKGCNLSHSQIQYQQYSGGRALEVLKERYAKGEITREEFQRMKDDINN